MSEPQETADNTPPQPLGTLRESVTVGGRTLTFETGDMARRANGAAWVREGQTAILATITASPRSLTDTRDFLPLTVDYRERASAIGRLPGGYGRREGRASEREILTSRLIDRCLRPTLEHLAGFDIQLQVIVFSADDSSDLTTLAVNAASAAIQVSDLAPREVIAAVRLTERKKTGLSANTHPKHHANARQQWIVAASRAGLVVADGDAREVPADEVLVALVQATAEAGTVREALTRLAKAAATPPNDGLTAAMPHAERAEASWAASKQTGTSWATEGRADGRAFDELRPIQARVGLLARCHGSALFTRGGTQALVTATLASMDERRDVEVLGGRRQERFFLHYNFPGFAVGEARANRGPGRRELGHGSLAQRALAPVVPDLDLQPLSVRLVSDILESDGSSSMASVCGGSMALMDAGVQIARPVVGIAMGLVGDGDRDIVLTDISGAEDHHGDMDLKVAGTSEGLTALQLDVKRAAGVPLATLEVAIRQARTAHERLLAEISAVIGAPRPTPPPSAPQVAVIQIDKSHVKRVIGAGGKRVQELQGRTHTKIDVMNSGRVRIFAREPRRLQEAIDAIQAMFVELKQGAVYWATVVSLKDYGAFVRLGGHDGLVHVSELAEGRVEDVSDVVKVGDRMAVLVRGVDKRGRLDLSRQAAVGTPEDHIQEL